MKVDLNEHQIAALARLMKASPYTTAKLVQVGEIARGPGGGSPVTLVEIGHGQVYHLPHDEDTEPVELPR